MASERREDNLAMGVGTGCGFKSKEDCANEVFRSESNCQYLPGTLFIWLAVRKWPYASLALAIEGIFDSRAR
jgi:hypothetical protein